NQTSTSSTSSTSSTADLIKKRKATQISEVLNLEEALSYAPPLLNYLLMLANRKPARNLTTNHLKYVFGKALSKTYHLKYVFGKEGSLEDVPSEPRFALHDRVIIEEDVRSLFSINFCEVLSNLMGPDYEYTRRDTKAAGIPDFN
ncbi:6553_t:CDS:2, partial [Funneliformis mosseae]